MATSPRWADLYRASLTWAQDAYSEFVAGLDPEVRHHLASGQDRVNVAVFGPTQQGKTSLLLRLLGVSEEDLLPLADILRGGVDAGKSSTAVPTRYRVVEDHNWDIQSPGAEPRSLDDERASAAFLEVRQRLDAGEDLPSEAVSIGIPRRWISGSTETTRVTIFDLPGDLGHAEHERLYVHRLARRYLAAADPIFMVLLSTDLQNVHVTGQDIPQLQGWTANPDRYRLVLTSAFLPESVHSLLTPDCTLDDIRQHYVHQIARFGSADPEEVTRPPYVIDIGISRKSIATAHPQIAKTAARLTEESLDELRRNIQHRVTPEQRLRAAWSSQAITERILTDRLTALGHLEEELDARIAAETESAAALARQVERYETEGEAIRRRRRRLTPPTKDDWGHKIDALVDDESDRDERHDLVQAHKALESAVVSAAERVWDDWIDSLPTQGPHSEFNRRQRQKKVRDQARQPIQSGQEWMTRSKIRRVFELRSIASYQERVAEDRLTAIRQVAKVLGAAAESEIKHRKAQQDELLGQARRRRRNARAAETSCRESLSELSSQRDLCATDIASLTADLENVSAITASLENAMTTHFQQAQSADLRLIHPLGDPLLVSEAGIRVTLRSGQADRLELLHD